jgi:hypothetical protein
VSIEEKKQRDITGKEAFWVLFGFGVLCLFFGLGYAAIIWVLIK